MPTDRPHLTTELRDPLHSVGTVTIRGFLPDPARFADKPGLAVMFDGRLCLSVETGAAVVSMDPTAQQARSIAAMLLRLADAMDAQQAERHRAAMGVAA